MQSTISPEEEPLRKLNRRQFVAGAGGLALAGAANPYRVYAAPATPPTPAAVTRRSIGAMQPNDPMIAAYRLAVERMKALPATDPRSWTRQTQIHVNNCPHGNWFFL